MAPRISTRSILVAFFDADRFAFGALDLAARGQALVAKHTQCFDFWALTAAFAEFQHFDITRAWQAVFAHRFFSLRQRAPENEQFSYVLNGRRIQLVGQDLKHGFACRAVIRKYADFDESMGVQGCIGFFFDSSGQAVSADHDHGVKVVGIGAVNFALGGCE